MNPPSEKEIRATLHLRRDGAVQDYAMNPLAAWCAEQGMLQEHYKSVRHKRQGIKHVRLTLLGWETLLRLNDKYGHDHSYV